jgi:hypothetical protein
VHSDQDLSRSGLGDGAVGDNQPAVDNGHALHRFTLFRGRGTVAGVIGLTFMDDDGQEVAFDQHEVACLLAVTGDLEGATVSACPHCHSRVVAAVALIDLIDGSAPFARSNELVELADDAPTLHLYVVDEITECAHVGWRDPLADEWSEVVEVDEPHAWR